MSSESFTEGHPDKVADQISDAVLDAVLDQDTDAVVACEALVTAGFALVAGELAAFGGADPALDITTIVRDTLERTGCTDDRFGISAETCSVLVSMEAPFSGSAGVPAGGDGPTGPVSAHPASAAQATVYGYATDEHPSFLPQPIAYAHALSRGLADVRREGGSPFGPNGTAMVTVEYEDQVPERVVAVVISTQHDDGVTVDEVESAVAEGVLGPVLAGQSGFDGCSLVVHSLGGWHTGWGLTGRKIIADTYGGIGRHGGGAFSGRDPSTLDRSGAYACRWVAKNLVAAGAASRCEVHLTYAGGRYEPLATAIDTFGTETVDPARIVDAVHEVFDLQPSSIVRDLDLRRPIYARTAAYGHFGRTETWCTWERLDRVPALTSALGLG